MRIAGCGFGDWCWGELFVVLALRDGTARRGCLAFAHNRYEQSNLGICTHTTALADPWIES